MKTKNNLFLEDPVQIVRLTMVKMCPVMKEMLVIPADRGLQLKFENIVSKMEMMESDRDVIMLLKVKLKEMRQMHSVKNEVLAEDKRKMDEEDRILKGKWAPSKGTTVSSGAKGKMIVRISVPSLFVVVFRRIHFKRNFQDNLLKRN